MAPMFFKCYTLLTSLLLGSTSLLMAQSPKQMPDKRIKILLIGTWHFDVNSTSDRNTSNLTDLTSPKRQREIDSVDAKLAAFRPDKFFVENIPAHQAHWGVAVRYKDQTFNTMMDYGKTILQRNNVLDSLSNKLLTLS